MKKLFRLSKPPVQKESLDSSLSTGVGVHPRLDFQLPPVPHPTPYYRIALIAASDGLLLRPVISGVLKPHAFVRIPWGNDIQPEEINYGPESANVNTTEASWNDAAVVYGILGCVRLTAGEALHLASLHR